MQIHLKYKRSLILVSLFFLLSDLKTSAQKPILCFSASFTWPYISSEQISNDGKTAIFIVSRITTGSSLFVQRIDGSWKREFVSAFDGAFTDDGRHLIFKISGDSLGILNLTTNTLRYYEHVANFKIPTGGNGQWLGIQMTGPSNQLMLLDFLSGQTEQYPAVENYVFCNNGHGLVIQKMDQKDSNCFFTITYRNFNNHVNKDIYQGRKSNHFVFDNSGTRLVFMSGSEIRYYHDGMDSAEVLVDSKSPGMNGMILSDNDIRFNGSANEVFFSVENQMAPGKIKEPRKDVSIDIFAHLPDSISVRNERGSFISVVHLNDSRYRVIRLQQDNDSRWYNFNRGGDDDYVLVGANAYGEYRDEKMKISARPDLYLVSTISGSRILLKKRLFGVVYCFSPGGRICPLV